MDPAFRISFFWKQKVDVVVPTAIRIPDKGEAVELIGREGVKGRGRVIDGLVDVVKVQHRWRHGAAQPRGEYRYLSLNEFVQDRSWTFPVRLEVITKGQVFESKYDMGGEFQERLMLSRVTGHGQMWIFFLLSTR